MTTTWKGETVVWNDAVRYGAVIGLLLSTKVVHCRARELRLLSRSFG